jgi:hypothetical protein
MLDSPITLLLIGISAASAIASLAARRRRRQSPPAPLTLSTLSDRDLLAALAALQTDGRPAPYPASAIPTGSEIRDQNHSASVTWATGADPDVHRRVTLLVIEEIARRGLRYSS